MGTFIYGNDESLECIQGVKLEGANDEPLCVGYKTTTTFFGAGVWFKDDGYVLKVSGKGGTYYPMPSGAELKSFQEQGLLPDPLPGYSVPLYKYGVGYSLWMLLAVVAAFMAWNSARKKKRMREDLEAPLSVGPPEVATEHDQFIAETLRPMLAVNEQIDQQAYGFTEPVRVNGDLTPGAKAAYCALTNQRLFFIHARVGAFGPLKENGGVEELPRSRLAAVVSDDGLMHFQLDDGSAKLLWVRRGERKFSNQLRFIRDLPKLFPAGAAARAA